MEVCVLFYEIWRTNLVMNNGSQLLLRLIAPTAKPHFGMQVGISGRRRNNSERSQWVADLGGFGRSDYISHESLTRHQFGYVR